MAKIVFFGSNEYQHLGVLYLEQNNYKKALQTFLKQSEVNEIAEKSILSCFDLQST